MRKLIYVAIGAGFLAVAAGLHYAVPRVTTAQIVGVEVKRVDAETGTRDVYMIQAQDPDTQRVRVFRNEDALFYLKLSSADVQARATALSRGEALRTAAIRHYGWRIPILSVFPNVISVREVEPGYSHTPILGPALILSLLGGVGALIWRTRKRKKARRSGPDISATAGRPGSGAAASTRGYDEGDLGSWLTSDDHRSGSNTPSGSSGSDGGGGSDA
jgi:Protein of unknown function (DUF1523).